jgi:hypothetical protein
VAVHRATPGRTEFVGASIELFDELDGADREWRVIAQA